MSTFILRGTTVAINNENIVHNNENNKHQQTHQWQKLGDHLRWMSLFILSLTLG